MYERIMSDKRARKKRGYM